jgi:hypothetical protein
MVLALGRRSLASLFSEALHIVRDRFAEGRARWRGVAWFADDIAACPCGSTRSGGSALLG